MKFYMEITLLPNPEVGIHFLWSKVFQQIHLGLVEMQDEQGRVPIGVAFPEYVQGVRSRLPVAHDTRTPQTEKYGVLGGKLRLFAAEETTLARFDAAKWLARLSDYVHCTSIHPVPEQPKGHACFQRLQPKASQERLARRYAKHRGVDMATALHHYQQHQPKPLAEPFIRLQSLSGGKTFCLWVKKTAVPEVHSGAFSSYGLSPQATVPDF